MSAHCCDHGHEHASAAAASPVYRRVLWVALAVNLAMFVVEIGAGLAAESVSLLADSLDFLGDAGNYAISLFVLGMALHWRARASLVKAASMAAFGAWVAITTIGHAMAGTVPEAPVMGVVGAGAGRQLRRRAAPLSLAQRRQQHAVCLDLHAQRRDRQSGGAGGRVGRVRLGQRLAGLSCRRDHVRPCPCRCRPGDARGRSRAASRP